jgi:hypothetical protein
VELVFERHPVFYSPAVAALSPNCDSPDDVVSAIELQLADPKQESYQRGRKAHLAKWCDSPSGKATERIADIIAKRLATHPEPDWSTLNANDRRRALKLKALQKIGAAYHYKPFLSLRGKALGGRHQLRAYIYTKSIKPKDVRHAMQLLQTRLQGQVVENLARA